PGAAARHRRGRLPAVRQRLQGLQGAERLRARARASGQEGASQAPRRGPGGVSGGPSVLIRRLDPTLALPSYALSGDAGMDLRPAVDVVLAPGERSRIPPGIAVAIPEGYAGFVQPRSGLAARTGFGFVNSPGLIDSGYRGEIQVVAINLDAREPIEIRRGDRI